MTLDSYYGNYTCPESITVTGCEYSYDSSTGVVTLSNATGNVTINATCPVDGYSVTANITNGSIESIDSILVPKEGSVTVQITPSSWLFYSYPRSVTVTGCKYSYNRSTGKLTLSNATEDVTITASCSW